MLFKTNKMSKIIAAFTIEHKNNVNIVKSRRLITAK